MNSDWNGLESCDRPASNAKRLCPKCNVKQVCTVIENVSTADGYTKRVVCGYCGEPIEEQGK